MGKWEKMFETNHPNSKGPPGRSKLRPYSRKSVRQPGSSISFQITNRLKDTTFINTHINKLMLFCIWFKANCYMFINYKHVRSHVWGWGQSICSTKDQLWGLWQRWLMMTRNSETPELADVGEWLTLYQKDAQHVSCHCILDRSYLQPCYSMAPERGDRFKHFHNPRRTGIKPLTCQLTHQTMPHRYLDQTWAPKSAATSDCCAEDGAGPKIPKLPFMISTLFSMYVNIVL